MPRKSPFAFIASFQRRDKELEAVAKAWRRVSARKRAICMIVLGVWDAPNPYGPRPQKLRSKKGETPWYLMQAMNILKESEGQLSDREIADRVGVSNSTLARSAAYMRARNAYRKAKIPRKVVTIDPRILGQTDNND